MFEPYNGHPCTQPTFRKIAAAAAADVKNEHEFAVEKEGKDVDGQQLIDVAAVEKIKIHQ